MAQHSIVDNSDRPLSSMQLYVYVAYRILPLSTYIYWSKMLSISCHNTVVAKVNIYIIASKAIFMDQNNFRVPKAVVIMSEKLWKNFFRPNICRTIGKICRPNICRAIVVKYFDQAFVEQLAIIFFCFFLNISMSQSNSRLKIFIEFQSRRVFELML